MLFSVPWPHVCALSVAKRGDQQLRPIAAASSVKVLRGPWTKELEDSMREVFEAFVSDFSGIVDVTACIYEADAMPRRYQGFGAAEAEAQSHG